ncbi:hypothetical protein XELAEV_18042500mg [Xenopus laevis]|uniref:Uncharacterized protein n=1 Tax=Xenopus laevis TaxID=8355 RepID=A0A974H6K1_XENLA|nr:hypothetical protein XELAEV_18042500mg [Xenopus laevis]
MYALMKKEIWVPCLICKQLLLYSFIRVGDRSTLNCCYISCASPLLWKELGCGRSACHPRRVPSYKSRSASAYTLWYCTTIPRNLQQTECGISLYIIQQFWLPLSLNCQLKTSVMNLSVQALILPLHSIIYHNKIRCVEFQIQLNSSSMFS